MSLTLGLGASELEVAKTVKTKTSVNEASYPPDVPFLFVDDISEVSANQDTARFYLLRKRPSLDDSKDRSDVIAEVAMGLNTFAFMSLTLYATIKQMIDKGALPPETLKKAQETLLLIDNDGKPLQKKAKKTP